MNKATQNNIYDIFLNNTAYIYVDLRYGISFHNSAHALSSQTKKGVV